MSTSTGTIPVPGAGEEIIPPETGTIPPSGAASEPTRITIHPLQEETDLAADAGGGEISLELAESGVATLVLSALGAESRIRRIALPDGLMTLNVQNSSAGPWLDRLIAALPDRSEMTDGQYDFGDIELTEDQESALTDKAWLPDT